MIARNLLFGRPRHQRLLLSGVLLFPMFMNAQLDRSRPPSPGPAPAVSMGEHKSFALPNGLRVIVVENRKLPLVSVQLRFDIPPFVQGQRAGLVDMAGDLLGAGTEARSKAEIDEAVDRMGATFSTSSDGVFISGLRRHADDMIGLLAEVARSATFPDEEVDKARVRYLSAIQQRKSDPDAIAEAVGKSATFSITHPYGEVMNEASVKSILADELRAYHRHFFRPGQGYLVLVGDLTAKEARKWAKQHFGKWKVPDMVEGRDENGRVLVKGLGPLEILEEPVGPRGVRRVVLVDRPGAAQSVIRVSHSLALEPRDLRAMNAQVMNTILGGGVFNARLMQNLREDKGYTYGAYSTLEADRFNGSFTASVSVRTEVTVEAIREILKEMERMRNEGVTREELDLARSFMAGSFGRSLEDPRTVARFALNTYLNKLESDHYATYLERLWKVGEEEVANAARAFLVPEQAVIFVVGDKAKIGKALEEVSLQANWPVMQVDENGQRWREPPLEKVNDRTADDVIEAYLEAIGGRTALNKVRELRMTMTAEAAGNTLTVTNWYGASGVFRSETKMGPMTVQEIIFDGQRAVTRGAQGERELEDLELEQVQRSALPFPELDMKRLAEHYSIVGRTTVNDRSAIKVNMLTHEGTAINDYFDEETGLRLRREEQRSMGGKFLTLTTDSTDPEAAGDVLFPRTLTQSGGPMGTLVMKVTEVVVNEATVPGFFETGLPPISDED